MRIVFIGAGSVVFTRNLTQGHPHVSRSSGRARSCSWTSTPTGSRVPKAREPDGRDGGSPARVSPPLIVARPSRGPTTSSSRSRWVGRPSGRPTYAVPERYGVGQCVGDTIGPGGIFRGLQAPGRLRRPDRGHGAAVPEGARPAVLQPHGHPHLAHGALGAAGGWPLPLRPGHGPSSRRVLRGPLRGAQLLGGRDQPPGLVPHPRAPGRRLLPPPAAAARQPRDARAWSLCVSSSCAASATS